MTITQNKVVTMDYKIVDANSGELIDCSENDQPMTYLHGAQNIVPGLERALTGKVLGDELQVTVAPADAYGERNEEGVQQVSVEAFEGMDKVEAGMTVTAQTPEGPLNLVITEVDSDMVTIDANHPMAGKSLTFSVKITGIRDANEEELAHGHDH